MMASPMGFAIMWKRRLSGILRRPTRWSRDYGWRDGCLPSRKNQGTAASNFLNNLTTSHNSRPPRTARDCPGFVTLTPSLLRGEEMTA